MALSAFPSPDELRGAVLGTVLYLSFYFLVLIPFQSLSKFYLVDKKRKEAKKDGSKRIRFAEVKYYNREDTLALRGDRAVGNFLEFSVVFLPLAWIRVLFVSTENAFAIFAVYTAFRALFALLFPSKYIFVATLPGYIVLMYLIVQIVTNV